MKLGALCPCPACRAGRTGNFSLDISFSDRRLSRPRLEQFGAVIQAIARRIDDRQLRLLSFLTYVSGDDPDLIAAELELAPQERGQIEAVLAGLEILPYQVPPIRINYWAELFKLTVLGFVGFVVWLFFLRG
jgi:hypothetical protein